MRHPLRDTHRHPSPSARRLPPPRLLLRRVLHLLGADDSRIHPWDHLRALRHRLRRSRCLLRRVPSPALLRMSSGQFLLPVSDRSIRMMCIFSVSGSAG